MRGRELRQRRLQVGVSQAEVAEMLGSYQTVISKIENDHILSGRDQKVKRALDELLPPLEKASSQAVEVDRTQLIDFISSWAAAEPWNAARQIVAAEMRARVRLG